MKIFIIDKEASSDHAKATLSIIRYYNPDIDIEHTALSSPVSLSQIKSCLEKILNTCSKDDYLLVTWTIPKNQDIDELFLTIADKCKKVICSAGNNNQDIEDLTPVNLSKKIDVVYCMRKNGAPATFSNYGNSLKGMYGTNITVNGAKRSGSSISAAIYAGIVIRNNDIRFLRRLTKKMQKKFEEQLKC